MFSIEQLKLNRISSVLPRWALPVLVIILSSSFVRCTPPNQSSGSTGTVTAFTGITNITMNPDGSWTVTWPVATGTDVQYVLFRAEKGEEFDYSKAHWSSATQNSYTSEQLTFADPVCYVVRMSSVEIISDGNSNVMCSTQEPYVWKGIESIQRDQTTGKYLLGWDAVNVLDPYYTIYRRDIDGEYSDPLSINSGNSFVTELPKRGSTYCYQVAFNDETTDAEFCTEKEDIIFFDGIHKVSYTEDDQIMSIRIISSLTEDVTAYRLYLDANRENIVSETPPEDMARYEDLLAFNLNSIKNDEIYIFTVRAIDKFGREDNNTRQLSLRGGNVNLYDTDDLGNEIAVSGVNHVKSSSVDNANAVEGIELELENGASDGFINIAERDLNLEVISVSGTNYQAISYAISPYSHACGDGQTYMPSVPKSKSSGFSTEGEYHVCARVIANDNSFGYIESPLIVLDRNSPPSADLSSFPGPAVGSVGIDIDFAINTSDYDSADIRRLAGATAPADCGSGTLVDTLTAFTDTMYVDTTTSAAAFYSYRICLYDESGNVTSVTTLNAMARTKHMVFATNDTFNGNFGGVTGADAECQTAADTADLRGGWVAVLSDGTNSAASRLAIEGSVYNLGGEILAADQAGFWDAALDNALGYDETGAALGASEAWSGGSAAASGSCTDWSSASSGVSAVVGDVLVADATWIDHGTPQTCNTANRLMCINQIADLPIVDSFPSGLSSGEIKVVVVFPATAFDYKKISIRHVAGATAPADCLSGTLESEFTEISTIATIMNYTPGSANSFRVCAYNHEDDLIKSYTIDNETATP